MTTGPLPPLPQGDTPLDRARRHPPPTDELAAAAVHPRPRRRIVVRRWRRLHLAPMVTWPAVTFWAACAVTVVAWLVFTAAWGRERGTGAALVFLVVVFGPRAARMERMVGAAYDLALPVCEFERWEARRKGRWRSRLKTWGVEIDYTTSELARAGTRKTKWIRLKLAPRLSLLPKEEHVQELGTRLPSPVPASQVIGELRKRYAEEFFGCPEEALIVRVERKLRRTWVWFKPGTPEQADEQRRAPSYAKVAERGNGN